MSILTMLLTVLGLCIFETVSSVDNAIIDAEVLTTLKPKSRKWFLYYGFPLAVLLVRGVLPWMIVWIATPGISPIQALTAAFHSDPRTLTAIEHSAPYLLMGGGVFLVLLFFQWIFLEAKQYGLKGEQFLYTKGTPFFLFSLLLLLGVIWTALQRDPFLAVAAACGSTVFFILQGLKRSAQQNEKTLMQKGKMSDMKKILYLEVIDATFSIDSVLGAFAFTLSVPLILLGNGLGALVVRLLTVGNIERIKKYRLLKNGAMYSIFCLGVIMLLGGFGMNVPEWVSPVVTITIIGFFCWRSKISPIRP
jgi:hypothetical protein